ncbi:MAG: hypothetical protein ABFS12_01135 [Bacteroidota bacterium]
MTYYEIIGYIGSLLVAVSLSMKNIRNLRKINFFGAFAFSVYGLIIEAYPVFILNGYIAAIDIYYLIKMNKTKEDFKLVPVLDKKHIYLEQFLEFYSDDIEIFFPDFRSLDLTKLNCFFVLRDLRPVGLLIIEEKSGDEIEIHLDYAIPDYRDLKSGKYVFNSEMKYFKTKGYKTLIARTKIKKHQKYLLNIGFIQSTKNEEFFTKNI